MDAHRAALSIPPEHPALPGHFPGDPLVPGVMILERIAAAWKAWRGTVPAHFDAKFVHPLRPGERASIVLQSEDAHGGRFAVERADGALLARGTLAAVPLGGANRGSDMIHCGVGR